MYDVRSYLSCENLAVLLSKICRSVMWYTPKIMMYVTF